MAAREPGAVASKQFSAEDLALQFGVTVAAARGWIKLGLIEHNKYGVIDRSMLLRFVNSAGGQSALAAARNPS
jgi:hypothetical protein